MGCYLDYLFDLHASCFKNGFKDVIAAIDTLMSYLSNYFYLIIRKGFVVQKNQFFNQIIKLLKLFGFSFNFLN